MQLHNPQCFTKYLGPWAIEPSRFSALVALAKSGQLHAAAPKGQAQEREPFLRDASGIAIIPIDGVIMKQESKFGGTSSLELRRSLRAAVADPEVKAILLSIDSPGGTVAGQSELADAVRSANVRKPVHAQINDLGASAAYWTASQARSVSANETALVGSIGTVAIIEDTSKAYEMDGIKVHVLSTGPYKGAFADGAPVTDEQLADMQAIVDNTNEFFLGAVAAGRGLSRTDTEAVADGRLWLAGQAMALGLVDNVRSMDDTLEAIRQDIALEASRASVASRMASSKRRAVSEALDRT